MNTADTTNADPNAKRTPTNDSDREPIAFQDRLMVAMFLIVGFVLGIIVLMDLFVGFFR